MTSRAAAARRGRPVAGLKRAPPPTCWLVARLQLVGGFGLFSTLFLLFVRFVPIVALSEVKACLTAADPHHPRGDEPARQVPTTTAELPAGRNGSAFGA